MSGRCDQLRASLPSVTDFQRFLCSTSHVIVFSVCSFNARVLKLLSWQLASEKEIPNLHGTNELNKGLIKTHKQTNRI